MLLILIAFPLFSHLDSFPIFEWDESRLAVNAVEMHQKGNNLLVPTFDYKPDMWNTKPPLLIWIQVLSIKLLGVSELALRLPSALSAVALCLLLYWFFSKKLQKELLGFMVCMVLITSKGYVMLHGTRTCDYDSLLTLFTTAYCLFFYQYLQTDKTKYLYLALVSMTLAVLTKGVAGLFFTPALTLYVLSSKKNLKIFRSKHLYFGLLILVVMAGTYYILREHYNPGYLKAVWENELGGRFGQVNETHEGPPTYYLKEMLKEQYTIWLVPMLLGVFTGVTSQNEEIKNITKFSLLLAVMLMFIISVSKTKLAWYSMPAFPWFAILTGVFLYTVYNFVAHNTGLKANNPNIVAVLFMLLAFIVPYISILNSISDDKMDDNRKQTMNMAYFLKDVKDGKHDISGYVVSWNGYYPNLDWYVKAYDYGDPETKKIFSWDAKPGDIVAAAHRDAKERLNNLFTTEVIRDYHGVTVYKITGYPSHE